MGKIKIITASAGSGKTWALTREYLKKLKSCSPASKAGKAACQLSREALAGSAGEILAITFTNAAAMEMRNRVVRLLKETALGINEGESIMTAQEASKWVDAILSDMNSLNIRTIDSLLHLIIRSSALDLGLNPDFEPAFATEDALAPYFEEFMESAKENNQYREMLEKACYALLDYSSSKGFTAGEKMTSRIVDFYNNSITGKLDGLSTEDEISAKVVQIKKNVSRAAMDLVSTAEQAAMLWDLRALKSIQRYSGQEASFPDNMSAYLEYGKTAKGLFRKGSPPVAKAVENAFLSLAGEARQYYELCPMLEQGKALLPFIKIASLVTAAYQSEMSREGCLPTALIPGYARKVFERENGVSDAICRLGARLTDFLVDEFQDTGDDQWQVMRSLIHEGLSRGGHLVSVGDVKQSIYSFRSANPKLFGAIAEDFELIDVGGRPESIPLRKNWRSAENIVKFNNTIFNMAAQYPENTLKLMLPNGIPPDILSSAAATLQSAYADAIQEAKNQDGACGFVSGKRIIGENMADLNSLVVSGICQTLNEIHNRRPWSDIMILTRDRTRAREVAHGLIEAGIPVITENSLLLAEHSLIIQIMAFLAFLANPGDDLAFWTLVSGSIFGGAANFDMDDLHAWAVSPRKTLLFQSFRKEYPKIWEKFLKPFHNQALLLTPYDIVMEWLSFMNVETRFSSDETFLRRFMEVVSAAESAGIKSVSSFIDYWNDKGREEKAPMPSHMDAVRIMTIHKAKGLEAPVVVVPWTSMNIRPAEETRAVELDGLVFPIRVESAKSGRPYYESYASQAIETLNLLYVAFTRPREELHFFHTSTKRKGGPFITSDQVMDWFFEKAGFTFPLRIGNEPETSGGKTPPEKEPETLDAPPPQLDEKSNWLPMGWLPDLKIFHGNYSNELSAKERGIFLHSCLENLQFNGDPENDGKTAFTIALRNSGIRIPEESHAGLLDAVTWFASIPRARAWLERGMTEQTLIDADGKPLRADLLIPGRDGFLVVDYKSGSDYPDYITKMRRYIHCVEQSGQYGGKGKGILVYLDLCKFKIVTMDGESTIEDVEELPAISTNY